MSGNKDASTSECSGRMNDRVRAGGRRIEGEPETPQSPSLAPGRCTTAVPGREMLGERSEKDVPPLVAGAGRLIGKKAVAVINRFPAVLLKELGYKTPPLRSARGLEQTSQIGEHHRPIPRPAADLFHDHLPRLHTVAPPAIQAPVKPNSDCLGNGTCDRDAS
jgi:hypothetical protein